MSVDILEFDLPSPNVIPDEVIPNLNMLHLEMLHRVEQILMALSLSHQRGTLSQMTPYSFKVCLIHKSCAQQLPDATYSASVDEREKQLCFLEDQITKEQPRNWHPPELDFLSTLSPAQSEFVNPSSLKFAPLGYHKPKFGV
mgnify:CR=1 FL=1